jgi:hypothetical protein
MQALEAAVNTVMQALEAAVNTVSCEQSYDGWTEMPEAGGGGGGEGGDHNIERTHNRSLLPTVESSSHENSGDE